MKIEIVPSTWASLGSGLVAGRYNAIIDAWTRTTQTPPTTDAGLHQARSTSPPRSFRAHPAGALSCLASRSRVQPARGSWPPHSNRVSAVADARPRPYDAESRGIDSTRGGWVLFSPALPCGEWNLFEAVLAMLALRAGRSNSERVRGQSADASSNDARDPGGDTLGRVARDALAVIGLTHASLRALGLPVPSIYGPGADEHPSADGGAERPVVELVKLARVLTTISPGGGCGCATAAVERHTGLRNLVSTGHR